MFMCEECNYMWESPQKYCGDPEESHCLKCGSAEIEETRPQNLAKPDAYSLLGEVAPHKGLHLGRVAVHCGKCNSTNIRLNIDSNTQKHFKFCPDCGMKVDWRNLA